ncbi:MAG: hypothetical protein CM1200mP32_00030 [Methanobacteriota archaeon]|nr:MAG: hypothetical protein CM1200mP32_00030 [Euryarchaeota archaeon]
MTLNLSMVQPVAQDIPGFLSAMILLTVFYWYMRLSQEGMKPSVQSRRTAALAYLALLPFIMFLLLRVLYLQHDPDPVMQNRWQVSFPFMDKVNTFKINPWPMEVVANFDERWMFLKAAIINSARVTLLSIVLCVILGTIVGVTRLSSNKLASTMATVYVEVFRNLPLAVLCSYCNPIRNPGSLVQRRNIPSQRGCVLQQSGNLVLDRGVIPEIAFGA